ncbi:anthranilate synthase component I [Bryobacterales bacterium F-183]|nr:anthranilate synthase component I [Bryobacterales bacterium F-183]
MRSTQYTTPHGIAVSSTVSKVPYQKGLRALLRKLDRQRGIYLSSGYEYPGRYSRWDIAAVAPPLEIVATNRLVIIRPLNDRGHQLLHIIWPILQGHPHWDTTYIAKSEKLLCHLKPLPEFFPEEERSKQPSAFSILRVLMQEFACASESRMAFVGAFGYDLLLQFDPIQKKLPREGVKDLHLFLVDEIYFMDRKKEEIECFRIDFSKDQHTTVGIPRKAQSLAKLKCKATGDITSDHTPEEYMAGVERVREGMKRGDYYEVVLRQTFSAAYSESPSELFERIQLASPSPYEFMLQLGDEQLIGASPEMFVRVEGKRVETCPIAGTTRRTGDPLRDADNIRDLLASAKEESELTMCTDVDRNDKSRVCVPGSVKVIGRRLIESYAGVFHTVDHVEGTLAEGFDSLDAFLTHMWAVTIIGAPKKWAAQAIEDNEKTARGWYGGAVGMIAMNGDINTGILIRTVHLRNGVAKYPVGATLLYDSIPENEELETRLKATGFFRALKAPVPATFETAAVAKDAPGAGIRMLLVDNEDCFIHTLANYARQTGAEVVTYRAGTFPLSKLREINPDVILVSPGPGRPVDFGVPDLVRAAANEGIPTFGVCLGLQGMVEAFGGELGILDYPMHGKPSTVIHKNVGVFEGLPTQFKIGRYHSLYALPEKLPSVLEVTAESDDGIIMGVRHRDLPLEAVQFHPESILSLEDNCGLRLIENMIRIHGRNRVAVAK